MRIIECVQGSPEWFKARRGIPTSSNFDKIITIDGKPSKQREKYLYQLAGEAVTKFTEEVYQSERMQLGKELESEAKEMYQLIKGVKVKIVGFCLSDKGNYGCSPDGLVGNPGLLETKCSSQAVHVENLLKGSFALDHWQQLQGQLLVTGRDWIDVMSYCPGLKPLIIRVKRDKKFLALLKGELLRFCFELKGIIKKIK